MLLLPKGVIRMTRKQIQAIIRGGKWVSKKK